MGKLDDRLDQRARDFLNESSDRRELLDAVRDENLKAGRGEAGKAQRTITTMVACTIIVWAVVMLFDWISGHGFISSTMVMLALVIGLFWGQYRESHERLFGWYALVAAVVLAVFGVIHFMGIA